MTTDHNKICRGKCTQCTCLSYKLKPLSNTCAECEHVSSKHELKVGCLGNGGCSCKVFVFVTGTSDCYSCGHDAKLHIGLKRTCLNLPSPSTTNPTAINNFRDLVEINKKKRTQYVEAISPKNAKFAKPKKIEANGAKFRRTIKIQLKRQRYRSSKKIFAPVGDQRQVVFYKVTTKENVIRACAEEFLQIKDDANFDCIIQSKGLELFLLDGKAVVTDDTYTNNKTTFNFCYTERSEQSFGDIGNDSNEYAVSRNPSSSITLLTDEETATGNMTLEDVFSCGKSIAYTSPKHEGEVFNISTFSTTKKEWQYLGEMRLKIGEDIAEGGMRKAMKAKIIKGNDHILLRQFRVGNNIVAKCYLENVCTAALAKGRSILSIARKEIQTQMVVRDIANEFGKAHAGKIEQFPSIIPAFIATSQGHEDIYMLEEMLDLDGGNFKKYMNNDGTETLFGSSCVHGRVALAFAHWSISFGKGTILVTDLQGIGSRLTDVELATTDKGYFGIGNVGSDAISTFINGHKCNEICIKLKLHETYDLKQVVQVPSKSKFTL